MCICQSRPNDAIHLICSNEDSSICEHGSLCTLYDACLKFYELYGLSNRSKKKYGKASAIVELIQMTSIVIH